MVTEFYTLTKLIDLEGVIRFCGYWDYQNNYNSWLLFFFLPCNFFCTRSNGHSLGQKSCRHNYSSCHGKPSVNLKQTLRVLWNVYIALDSAYFSFKMLRLLRKKHSTRKTCSCDLASIFFTLRNVRHNYPYILLAMCASL